MGIPLRHNRGQKKPYGSVPRIDWSHPFAAKLVTYMYDLGGGVVIDLVTGSIAVTVSNSGTPAIPKTTRYGSALVNPGSAGGQWIKKCSSSPATDNVSAAAPYSFAAGYMPTGTRLGGTAPVFALTNNGGNWEILIGCFPNFGAGGVSITVGDGTPFSVTSTEAAINSFNTTGGVMTSSSSVTGWHQDAAQGFKTTTLGAGLNTFTGTNPIFFGLDTNPATGGGSNDYVGAVFYGAIWKGRALSETEFKQLHYDPYCFLIYPEDEMLALLVGAAATGVSGTLATTEAADVAAFAGQVVISATLATTEGQDVAAFAGSLGAGPITGTLATTEAADVVAFAGNVTWTGTLATTEAPDTALFNGRAGWTGTLATTEAQDTALFNGLVAISAILATTEAADTALFNGGVAWTGTLATTEAKDTALFNGQVIILASLVTTEGQDVANFTGSGVGVSGTLATTEAADTVLFNGQVVITAVLATVEAQDSALFAGTVLAVISGTLATTEAQDSALFNGTVFTVITGTLATTEAKDTALFNGVVVVPITGTLAVTEARDVVSFNGVVVVLGPDGYLSAFERPDTARFVVTSPPLAPGDLQYGWPNVIVRRRL